MICILESFLEKPSLSFSERHSLYSYEKYTYTIIVRAILEETRRGKQRECYQTLFSFLSSYCRQYTVSCTTFQACIPVFQTFQAICQEITHILSCCPSMQVLLTESRFIEISYSIFSELIIFPNKATILSSLDLADIQTFLPMLLTLDPRDEKQLIKEFVKDPLTLQFRQLLSQSNLFPVLKAMEQWKESIPGFDEWKRSLFSTFTPEQLQQALKNIQPFPFSSVIPLLPFLSSVSHLTLLSIIQSSAQTAIDSLVEWNQEEQIKCISDIFASTSISKSGLALARLLCMLSTIPQLPLQRLLAKTGVLETLVIALHNALQRQQRPEEDLLNALSLFTSHHRHQADRLLTTFFCIRWSSKTFSKRVEHYCLSTPAMTRLLSECSRATILQLLQQPSQPVHSSLIIPYLGEHDYRYDVKRKEEMCDEHDRQYWIQAELVRNY